MKWFLVVFFMEGLGSYVFFNPNFDTLEACRFSANYPPHIQIYARKMLQEYGSPRPVERVVCMEEDTLKEFMKANEDEIQQGISL